MRPALGRLEFAVALVLLAAGSALSCVIAAVWLTARIGGIPVPLVVLGAGLWSVVLVRVARLWSPSRLVAAFPVAVWVLTLVALGLGPGGNAPVPVGLRSTALVVAAVVVPSWVAALAPVRSGVAPQAERG